MVQESSRIGYVLIRELNRVERYKQAFLEKRGRRVENHQRGEKKTPMALRRPVMDRSARRPVKATVHAGVLPEIGRCASHHPSCRRLVHLYNR